MGTIDKMWFRFECESCGTTETHGVSDKGSGMGGSAWSAIGSLDHFDVESTGGGRSEPEILSATCNACSTNAKTRSAYGFNKPEDF